MSSDSLPGVAAGQAGENTFIQFDDNALLPLLYGEHDQHLLIAFSRNKKQTELLRVSLDSIDALLGR